MDVNTRDVLTLADTTLKIPKSHVSLVYLNLFLFLLVLGCPADGIGG